MSGEWNAKHGELIKFGFECCLTLHSWARNFEMEKRKRRGYVYHDFVVRCGVFGNTSWRRPRFFLRIQSLWSMSVYVSHLIDEVIGNQKESIVKRYVTFSSWFGESIHCERILTCGPQFFHFSFSAIKKSFPMFKSSTSRLLYRNILS